MRTSPTFSAIFSTDASCQALGVPDSSVGKEFACNAGDPGWFLGQEDPSWRRDRLPTPVFWGFPCGSAGKESACNVGDLSLIPALGRSPGEGNGYPLQYSGLENSIECIVHGVAKSQTRLSDFHFHCQALARHGRSHSKETKNLCVNAGHGDRNQSNR